MLVALKPQKIAGFKNSIVSLSGVSILYFFLLLGVEAYSRFAKYKFHTHFVMLLGAIMKDQIGSKWVQMGLNNQVVKNGPKQIKCKNGSLLPKSNYKEWKETEFRNRIDTPALHRQTLPSVSP